MNDLLYFNILNIVYMCVMLFVIIRSYRMIEAGNKQLMLAVFFTFATASLFVENIYWIAYDFLRPEARMPIAANEIAEDAAFLMLSAVLVNAIGGGIKGAVQELIGAAVFAVASIALWIAWSGEWLQDIIGGAAFGYLICRCVWALKLSGAVLPWEWRGLGFGAMLLIALETYIFAAPQALQTILNNICYGILFAILIFLIVKMLKAFKDRTDPKILLSLCFSCYTWSLSSMYMSEEPPYLIFYISSMAVFPLMMLAVERMVHAE